MTKTGRIIYPLLLLLLLLGNKTANCSQVLADKLYGDDPVVTAAPIVIAPTGGITTISRHTLLKDKIKIRYMGGDCSYGVVVPLPVTIAAVCCERTAWWHCASRIVSSHSGRYLLRGPPCDA